MDSGYFLFVANGFQQGYGRCAVDYQASGADCRVDGVIGFCGIHQDAMGIEAVEVIAYLFIRVHRDAVCAEVYGQFGCNLLWLNEIIHFVFLNQQVAHDNRIAVHVIPPDVEQPGYLIQSRQQQGVCPGCFHGLPDGGQLFCKAHSGILCVVNKGRR